MRIFGQFLADGGDLGHMSGWGWSWMVVGTLFWAAIVGLVLWTVLRGRPSDGRLVDPEGILAERFARGEISSEEFAERREALRKS